MANRMNWGRVEKERQMSEQGTESSSESGPTAEYVVRREDDCAPIASAPMLSLRASLRSKQIEQHHNRLLYLYELLMRGINTYARYGDYRPLQESVFGIEDYRTRQKLLLLFERDLGLTLSAHSGARLVIIRGWKPRNRLTMAQEMKPKVRKLLENSV